MFIKCARLRSYPEDHWDVPPSERWLALAGELREWQPPVVTVAFDCAQRKWEVVSAYQKCVRRGWNDWAQQLVGAALPWGPEQWRYLWSRICTAACEDVGYGDPELMRFVIACATVFPPSSGEEMIRHAWSFLTARMCDTQRSRILCQLSLLEDWNVREHVPEPPALTLWDESILTDIRLRSNRLHSLWTRSAFHAWHLKNSWRSQNILKFSVYDCPIEPVQSLQEVPPSEVLSRLPDFCYDMHTRVGKRTCRNVAGLPLAREFFNAHPTSQPGDAVGWALFLSEGGLILGGVTDPRLSLLEQKYVAARLGWSHSTWLPFQREILGLLHDGTVNRIRRSALSEQAYRDESV